jgi:hypothetical protein
MALLTAEGTRLEECRLSLLMDGTLFGGALLLLCWYLQRSELTCQINAWASK